MAIPGEGDPDVGLLRAEADHIERAATAAEERLLRLAWHGPDAADARDRATERRRRAADLADSLRRLADLIEAGELGRS